MGKRVFMFPGQGSQYIGMGKEICEKYPVAKEVFDKASEITGLDVAAMCFEENDKINITEYTQICMLTVEAALFAVLKEKGITYDLTAGLSLGEYGALIASGAISMEDAFAIVRKRGIYMQNAVPEGGGMSADDYFAIALPSDADFKAWTRSMFARADALNARLVQAFPHLFKTKRADGGDLLPVAE